ncbi:sla2 Src-like adaptor 2 [Blyttiomyces sp. JEL0837]|nr:sla2 Src-like adaptor 2 [Blyttiomyces sp. JEL0837]
MSYGKNYPGSAYDTYSSSSSRYSPPSNRGNFGSEKLEEELATAIKKALAPEESAPKQKHVRTCIVYTHDIKGPGSLWQSLRGYPMAGDEVVIYKALVTIHKVLNQGHPVALQDICHEHGWVEALGRNSGGFRGYGGLIKTYIQYLVAKMDYHRLHPEFSGSFDYQEYVTLKGVEDPNEGYFLRLLMTSLACLVKSTPWRVMSSIIFDQEWETNAVKMLMAMHQIIGSVEVLAPLREKFNQSHYALYKFYYECSGLKYLTSLIAIPKLDKSPPDFLAQGPPQLPPRRPITPPPSKSEDDLIAKQQAELEAQIRAENQKLEAQRQEAEKIRQRELERQQQLENQRLLELQRQQALYDQQRKAEEERLRQLQLQQQQQLEAQQYSALIDSMRNQANRDRETIDLYDKRVRSLEQQLATLNLNSNEGLIKSLQDELAQWKQKYEALAKLYAQLRKEHLDLLNKFKEIKDGSGKQADEVRKELEKVREELKAKSLQMTDLMVERDRLKNEADRIRLNSEEELARLKRDLQDTKNSLARQQTIDDLRRRVDQLTAEAQRLRSSKDEESSVLQSGLDQTLLALAQLQKTQQETEASLLAQIDRIRAEHLIQMNRMMDNILQTCVTKVDAAIFDFDDQTQTGNVNASPEYVQSLLEKTVGQAGDFAASFLKLLQGGDQSDAISTSNALAVGLEQLLYNTKGILRLAKDEEGAEQIVKTAKEGATNTKAFFEKLKSNILASIDPSRKSDHVNTLARDAVVGLLNISPLVEQLAPKDTLDALGGDIGDIVEKEMQAAAKAIEDAARRLQELMAQPSFDLNVNGAILHSAMALTNAIAQLIRCATVSQQEIVAHGRGSTGGSNAAFYKKNNKWTEGLVSAAKSVAVATTFLVECADGLVKGTHSIEQLIVAAQEVGVATTQLVAASRVKAVPFSKAQDRLEDAAVAVREATKLLVKAARDAAKLRSEQLAREEIGKMGRHEMKIKEMEQQVRILELEKELGQARYKLGEIRKQGYNEDA